MSPLTATDYLLLASSTSKSSASISTSVGGGYTNETSASTSISKTALTYSARRSGLTECRGPTLYIIIIINLTKV